MDANIKKYKLGNLIVSIVIGVNFIIMVLLGSGLFENVENQIFENYFLLSFTLIPLICVGFLIALKIRYNMIENINYKDYSLYLPFIQAILIMLCLGIKFTIQLDREILAEIIVTTFTFILFEGTLLLYLREEKISKRKFYIINILSFISMITYVGLLLMFAYDYSVLI